MPRVKHRAFIALGSNVGDRHGHIRLALQSIGGHPELKVVRSSTLLETAPVDCPPGAEPFVNAAASLATTLDPFELLDLLLSVEQKLGRQRTVRNAPRTIDLDLLLYDQLVWSDGRLTVPHPRLHERRFVLEPLAEIAPNHVHPVLKRTMRSLLHELDV